MLLQIEVFWDFKPCRVVNSPQRSKDCSAPIFMVAVLGHLTLKWGRYTYAKR
jgi:hypothetical protein